MMPQVNLPRQGLVSKFEVHSGIIELTVVADMNK